MAKSKKDEKTRGERRRIPVDSISQWSVV